MTSAASAMTARGLLPWPATRAAPRPPRGIAPVSSGGGGVPARSRAAPRPAPRPATPRPRSPPAARTPSREDADGAPHVSVLMRQVLECFEGRALRHHVDGTMGAGGHASAVVRAHPEMRAFVGFDVDPRARHPRGRASRLPPRTPAAPPTPTPPPPPPPSSTPSPPTSATCASDCSTSTFPPSTASSSTSASPPCTSISPSAASVSTTTDPWTCAWGPPPPSPRRRSSRLAEEEIARVLGDLRPRETLAAPRQAHLRAARRRAHNHHETTRRRAPVACPARKEEGRKRPPTTRVPGDPPSTPDEPNWCEGGPSRRRSNRSRRGDDWPSSVSTRWRIESSRRRFGARRGERRRQIDRFGVGTSTESPPEDREARHQETHRADAGEVKANVRSRSAKLRICEKL